MSRGKLDRLPGDGLRIYAKLAADVTREIVKALKVESKERGFNRADLARMIGRDKAFVTRKLAGSTNMELRTIASFMAALGYELDVKARRIDPLRREKKNDVTASESQNSFVADEMSEKIMRRSSYKSRETRVEYSDVY